MSHAGPHRAEATSATGDQATPWHALPTSDVISRYATDTDRGLSNREAQVRLRQYGPNRTREEPRAPLWKAFIEHIREPMLLLLMVVGVLYLIFGSLTDAAIVWTIVLVIVSIEVVSERRAENAIVALHALAEPLVPVRRDGQAVQVPASEVVPGDVLLLEAGRRVAADARLVESHSLLVDESLLTGESVGVEKQAEVVLRDTTPLAERRNMVFAGTTILRGRGTAVVVATGPAMELGRIAELAIRAEEAEEEPTPAQQTLRQMARWMVWLAAGFSVGIPLVGWLTGQPLQTMLLTGFALFFASVPEELPVIITLVLALGSYSLSRRKAIVRRRRAVEMLGSISVIAADKTGTLTENRMTVEEFWPQNAAARLLTIGALCNDVALDGMAAFGDPLDRALLEGARTYGLDVAALRAAHPLVDEYSFDDRRKRMSISVKEDRGLWVVVKGAPESILTVCTTLLVNGAAVPLAADRRAAILETVARLAHAGLRVVAMAEKKVAPSEGISQAEAERELTFVGLVGMEDPLRPGVRAAIESCRLAGIRTVIISGDHPVTVGAVAEQLGFPVGAGILAGQELATLSEPAFQDAVQHTAVFARITPEQKLRIVRSLTRHGQRVAVTGDGINDVPALAAAEIGVAMGQTGTDAARAAADIVLMDDSFGTLKEAIQRGRTLFANLEKGIRYYLACKTALVSSSLVAVLLQVPIPFLPVQIILMELIMDLAASTGFLAEPDERNVMSRPPRDPRQPVLNRTTVTVLLASGLGLAAAVIVAYLVTWYGSGDGGRSHTVAFATWLLGHVFMASTLRSEQPLLRVGILSNRAIAVWGLAVFVLLGLIATVPPIQTVTRTVGLSGFDWALVIGAAVLGTLWREPVKYARAVRKGTNAAGT